MIGYRLMKEKGKWKIERKGYDIIFTRKGYDKETGEELAEKSRAITYAELENKKTSINTQISQMQLDVQDYEAAMHDFKQEEAKTP